MIRIEDGIQSEIMYECATRDAVSREFLLKFAPAPSPNFAKTATQFDFFEK